MLLARRGIGGGRLHVGATQPDPRLRQATRAVRQATRPIGKFQAVQHRLVDIDVEHDTAEAIAFAAAEHIDRGADVVQRARLASSAKAQVGWSGRFVGEEAVQLHGAIAMTNDLPVGHYLKRLTAIGVAFGDSAYHVRRFQSLDGRSAPAG